MDWFDRIFAWGVERPYRVALTSGLRRVTYGELIGRACGLATHLSSVLPDDGTPVAIVGHKEPEMVMGFLGAALAGHPYVPIDSGMPAARVSRIVEVARVARTLTVADIARLATPSETRAPERRRPDDHPYYVMFTSGSTGEPKGVVITRGCVGSFIQWMLGEQRLEPAAECFLNQVLYSFDVSVLDLYLSLVTGGTHVSLTRDDIADFTRLFSALADSAVTVWVSTPSFARLCLAEPRFERRMLPAVRRFLLLGETLAPEIARQLLARFPGAEVWNLYGPTEATVAATSVEVTTDLLARHAVLPIGYPKPGTAVFVTAEGGLEPLAEGQRGEIVIAGDNVSPGYLGRPDLTARRFADYHGQRAYLTGDLGHVQDGLVFFDGRRDQQVKLHGYRVELGDVEANLCALDGIRDAVVLPVLRNGEVDSLAAFVITESDAPRPDGAGVLWLRSRLGDRVPSYMLPRTVRFLHQFPMTANGKVDRHKLAESL
jgi:D-alanine--poly(phosphoribitol) ligase subunit 1